MKRLEDELRLLLGRRDPPPGFADRVMIRIEAERGNHPARQWALMGGWRDGLLAALRRPWLGWAAALAMAVVLMIGAAAYRRERRARLEGERARDQAILALRIASAKLNDTLRQARRVEHHQVPLGKAKRGVERL